MGLADKTISGLFWKFAERSGAQIIQFVVSIVLARILTPADYGLTGLITVFISIALSFAQSGLGQALVQKKDADETDFSTVFYYSLVLSMVLYFVLYVCAPLIADFYEEIRLVKIIRVLGITVIIGSVHSVQQAYIQKKMQFKRFFWATLAGTISSAFVGIYMAYTGYGVWALVGQQITNQLINVIVLWFNMEWRPGLKVSFGRAKQLLSFSWKLLCSGLLEKVYANIYSLLIGKFYSPAEVGYYNRGKQFPMLIVENINMSIDNVLFPVMSEVQNETKRMKGMVRRSITVSTFLLFPAMAGLAAISKPLVLAVLTEKWLPAVPFIQFCCITFAFMPIHTANLQAIKALGRSDIFLKLEILKKIVGIIILILTIPMGLYAMMIGRCVSTFINSIINAFPNKKLLGYSYIEQIRDIMPSLLLSLAMFFAVLPLTMLSLNSIAILILQGISGVVIYFAGAKIFRIDCLEYILAKLKSFIKRR